MYTTTAGLAFDTPEDAERAADLLNALFERAQADEQVSVDPSLTTPTTPLEDAKEALDSPKPR